MGIFFKLGNEQQLITESVIADSTCQTQDPAFVPNPVGSGGLLFFVFSLSTYEVVTE